MPGGKRSITSSSSLVTQFTQTQRIVIAGYRRHSREELVIRRNHGKTGENHRRKSAAAPPSHGGDLELVDQTADGYVRVKLTGACATCPGAQQTLAEVVETALREAAPEVKGVIPVHSVDEYLIRQTLAIIRKGQN